MKPTLPIIVITAQPNQREWVTAAGAHALLEKPLDLPLLLKTIGDFVEEPPVIRPDSRRRQAQTFPLWLAAPQRDRFSPVNSPQWY